MDTTTSTLPAPTSHEADDMAFGQLARLVELRQDPTRYSMTIDGEEFPYHTAADDTIVSVPYQGLPFLTFTLLAEHVQIDNRLHTLRRPVSEPWDIPDATASRPLRAGKASGWAARMRAKQADTMIDGYAFAGIVQLRGYAFNWQMTIDGEVFPYRLARTAYIPVTTGEIPKVEITLPAERITMDLAERRPAADSG
ncbi:hypothetical protein GCM10022252_76120 [Streptosporangium oxazolinicum]|uniref:Uncharacterized protein n=1 Tax=Streptosporangium oxazolinicum TaxID=909287 RepID=A0ABP8BL07_9ACTN